MELETAELLDKILKYLDNGKIRKSWLDILTDLEINTEKERKLFIELDSRDYILEQNYTASSKKFISITQSGRNFINTSSFVQLTEKENQDDELKKLQKINLELHNENFEFSKTIRKQEAIIRKLDIFAKFVDLLKAFKWVICTLISILLFLLLY